MPELAANFSFDTMYNNLMAAATSLRTLIMAFSYIIGVGMVFRGLALYKAFGQHITQMSSRGEVSGPMVFIVVGAMMVYLPSTIDASLVTIYGSSSTSTIQDMIGYAGSGLDQKWRQVSEIVVIYLKLIGLIAFIRGWIILSKMGHAGSQPGSIAKGITHVIGGILLINLIDTINLFATTFGFS